MLMVRAVYNCYNLCTKDLQLSEFSMRQGIEWHFETFYFL